MSQLSTNSIDEPETKQSNQESLEDVKELLVEVASSLRKAIKFQETTMRQLFTMQQETHALVRDR